MTNKHKIIATNQTILDFDTPIEAYSRLRDEILNAPPPTSGVESYDELVTELAVIVKKTIRDSGLSRDHIVDGINEYLHRSKSDKRKCLTISTFNNYLSKPLLYPVPVYILIAIQHVCRSLKPIGWVAELEGGKVITSSEVRELSMGKLDKAIKEMQQLKRDLMGKKHE